MTSGRFRRGGFALLLALAASAVPAAEAPPPGANETVNLPPLLVEWKGAPLRWRYLAQPGFELLTVCSEETAVAFAQRNHRLLELLRTLIADRFLSKSSVPEIHVIFDEDIARARSREVINEMVQELGLRPDLDGNLHLARETEPVSMSLALNSGQGVPRIVRIRPKQVIFLPNLRLQEADSLGVFSILPAKSTNLTFGYSADRLQVLLETRAPALPPWFVAGMLGIFRQAQYGEDEVTLPRLIWLDEVESRALARNSDQPRLLLPMAELFGRRRPAAGTAPTETDAIWAAQGALFVRWALADPTGARRAALEKFVDRLEGEAPSEALFRESFGLGYADARDRLSDYLPEAVVRRLELRGPPPGPLPRIQVRPATPLEVARIRGNWERREIAYVRARYPALAESYLNKARVTLYRAYETGERDSRLLAELGLTELEGDDPAKARQFLEGAFAGGTIRPLAAYELARLRYVDLPAGDSPLTAREAARVLEPLRAALALAPPQREAYALLAAVAIRRGVAPEAPDLAWLNEGVRLYPSVSAYALQVAGFNVARGDLEAARRCLELGEAKAEDPAMRAKFAQARARLAPLAR